VNIQHTTSQTLYSKLWLCPQNSWKQWNLRRRNPIKHSYLLQPLIKYLKFSTTKEKERGHLNRGIWVSPDKNIVLFHLNRVLVCGFWGCSSLENRNWSTLYQQDFVTVSNLRRRYCQPSCWMAETTSEMELNFRLSLRRILARLRARPSQSARLVASAIDSKSSTWATPTILLLPKEGKKTLVR